MKRILFIFLVLACFSCGDDDSKNKDNAVKTNLWYYAFVGSDEDHLVPFEHMDNCTGSSLSLKSNGTFTGIGRNPDCSPIITDGTWSQTDNVITLNFPENIVMFLTIVSLTEQEMRVIRTFQEIDGSTYYVFTRQSP